MSLSITPLSVLFHACMHDQCLLEKLPYNIHRYHKVIIIGFLSLYCLHSSFAYRDQFTHSNDYWLHMLIIIISLIFRLKSFIRIAWECQVKTWNGFLIGNDVLAKNIVCYGWIEDVMYILTPIDRKRRMKVEKHQKRKWQRRLLWLEKKNIQIKSREEKKTTSTSLLFNVIQSKIQTNLNGNQQWHKQIDFTFACFHFKLHLKNSFWRLCNYLLFKK